MRSRRTVRSGGEDRSWFGPPQAIKKAAGNAATKGTSASKVLSYQRDHPLKANSGAVDAVYELPKKRRVPNPSAYDASSPHRRERIEDDGINTYGSSPSRQKVPGVRQPRKSRGPTLCLCSTHSPFRRRLSKCSPRYGPGAIRRRAHLKGGCGTPLKVVETWLLLQRSLTSFLF